MGVFYFYVVAIGFALGIFVRSFWQLGFAEVGFLLLLSFGLALVWRRESFASSAPVFLFSSLLLLAIALGVLRLDYVENKNNFPILENQIGQSIEFTGLISREVDVRSNSTNLYVEAFGSTILVRTDRYVDFNYGDQVLVVGELSNPESFETDLGRIFDYPGYLKARGVLYTVSFAEVRLLATGQGNLILQKLFWGKQVFMSALERVLPEPEVGLAEGLLLGVKRALGADLETAFRKTGIIHIVVLSGYNVMLVVAFVMYLLSFLKPDRLRLYFGLLGIVAFAFLVGLSATVVRASIMAALLLLARASNRTYLVLRALILAGLVMLVINPYLLAFDTGFQLSFMATLGLILVAPHLEARLTLMPKTIGLREFLTATLATQIFVMPILLYQIGEFSVVAVAVNLLVLPMVPVAMLLTFMTGLVGIFASGLVAPFSYLTYFSLTYIIAIATWFADLSFASYQVPTFSFWLVLVGYGFLACLIWWFYRQPKKLSQSKTISLVGWVIEDEDEVTDSGVESVPIFFR